MPYRKKPKRQYDVRRSRSPRPFKHIRVEEYSSFEAVWKIENPMPELMERINRLRRRGFPVKKTGKTFFIGPVYLISDVQEIRRILNLEGSGEWLGGRG
jgi:hypothetical protein